MKHPPDGGARHPHLAADVLRPPMPEDAALHCGRAPHSAHRLDRETPRLATQRLASAIDSHFIGRARSAGCVTIRCQMTAWNASACGVTVSGLTVGTITQTSATRAVKPPSRPTTPMIPAPTCLAYSSARTRLGLTF